MSTTKKIYLNEIFMLRAVACLSIVLVHSLTVAQSGISNISDYLDIVVNSVRVLLTFGTPTFVFISMLLISYSYPNGLPTTFLGRRAKLILLPYLSMAVFYALFHGLASALPIKEILINASLYILGAYHGYFVLIIFQFYLLCYFFNNYLSKKNPFTVILISLIINLIYLAIFNFSSSPIDNSLVNYFWVRWHWIPFIGWVFYFTVAYYCGKNYSKSLFLLNKNKNLILASTVSIGALTVILANLKIIPLSSKSIMMIFFATSMIATLYYIATKVKDTPYLFRKISEYSFSIYLLHMFFISVVSKALKVLGIDLGILNVVFLFIGSIIGSMLMTYIINRFKFGKYLVGRINSVGVKAKLGYGHRSLRS